MVNLEEIMKTIQIAIGLLTMVLCCVFPAHSQSGPQSNEPAAAAGKTTEVVLKSEIKWGPLNPARGDAGPRAGTLWGDRTGAGPSGFLVQFKDGFSSPPHIHNVSYRGVVIDGLVHNDDPEAENMWLSPGSYWTQPAGDVHITSARGSNVIAYIEIESGPYLVKPTEQAFDNGESSINVDEPNLVWLSTSAIVWTNQPGNTSSSRDPKLAFLWGSPKKDQPNGSLLKLPAGYDGEIRSKNAFMRTIVIQGRLNHNHPGASVKNLEPGSYFGSEKEVMNQISCTEDSECILYIHTDGRYEVH